jgi:hypothetical protein
MPPKTPTWGQAGLVTVAVAVVVFMSAMLVIIDDHLNHICRVVQGGC